MNKTLKVLAVICLSVVSMTEAHTEGTIDSEKIKLHLDVQNLDTGKRVWFGQTLPSVNNIQVTVEANGFDCAGQYLITALGDPATGALPSVIVLQGTYFLGPSVGEDSFTLPIFESQVRPDGFNDWKVSVACNGIATKQVAFRFFEFFVHIP